MLKTKIEPYLKKKGLTIPRIATSLSLVAISGLLAFFFLVAREFVGFPNGQYPADLRASQQADLLVLALPNLLFCCFYLALPFFVDKAKFWKYLSIGTVVYVGTLVLIVVLNA